MSTIPPPQFYVYILAYPPHGKEAIGKVFYVGKGKDNRVFRHEAEARRGHQCPKCDVIRQIWQTGGEVQRLTIYTTDDEAAAYAYECDMITLYGIDTLVNRNVGGAGNPYTDADRAKLSASCKARWDDPEFREKGSAINKARVSDPASRARQSAVVKSKWEDPSYRAKATAAITAGTNTPEWRAQMSERAKAMWADPKIRAELAEKRKQQGQHSKASATPESRAAASARAKARWADPEYKARVSAAVKEGRWNKKNKE